MRHYDHMRSALFSLGALVLLLIPSFVSADELFVPLTGIPGVETIARQGGSLTDFFNMLYRLCVGAAAVIAVIQITRAGAMYMLGDSFTEKKEAKHLIYMSIFGLVLVLTPTIVFSIIDERILSLNFDASDLRLTPLEDIDFSIGGPSGGNENGEEPPTIEDYTDAAGACDVTLTAEQVACLEEESTTSSHVQDCLMEGGLDHNEARCVMSQAQSEDPGTIDEYPGAVDGTYISYGPFNFQQGPPAVGADQVATAWISASCASPRVGALLGSCTGESFGVCSSVRATCESAVTVKIVRISEAGAWVDVGVNWTGLRSADNRAIDTFRNECRAAVRAFNWEQVNTMTGGGVDSRIDTERSGEHECTQAEITGAGRAYSSDSEYQCADERYTCDIRP